MKILLANYRYFLSGGPERYMFEVKKALEDQGHTVIPFSIRYKQNVTTPYADYFVSPLAGEEAVRFDEHKWTPMSLLKTLERAFYSPEVERAVCRLVHDAQPDVAYVLHYLKKLSPALLVGLRKTGVPIVVRISDFLMLCPQALFLRDEKPCTLCSLGRLWPSIRYRCVKGSLLASLIHAASTVYHRRRGFFDLIDRFVIPSEFTLQYMLRAGWPSQKLVHIPTFASDEFFAESDVRQQQARSHILFVGHLEPHKGPHVLLRAYAELMKKRTLPPLVIVGATDRPFAASCIDLCKSLDISQHVKFVGFKTGNELVGLYKSALFTVLPSLCFENMPNVLLESFAAGTAVIGSDHGSIKELIRHGETGLLFETGNSHSLATMMEQALSNDWASKAGRCALEKARHCFSKARHVEQLVLVFSQVCSERKRGGLSVASAFPTSGVYS